LESSKALDRKYKRKKLHGEPRRRLKDSIKIRDIKYECVDWSRQAHVKGPKAGICQHGDDDRKEFLYQLDF
jgi:hypothetical protein